MITESPFALNDWLKEHPGAGLYFVGIGGCGMSGLAHLAVDAGFRVAGSDLSHKEYLESLKGRGVAIELGHSVDHLEGFKPDLLVVSSAIPESNPQFEAARQWNVPMVHRAALLGALSRTKRSLCVAGMHGKTTTSGLLAYALQNLNAPMSHAIGGRVPQLVRHGNHIAPVSLSAQSEGIPPYMVVETDESDGSLLEFEPDHAICLNIDREHMDYYGSIDDIVQVFERFRDRVRGKTLYCVDDARLREVFMGHEQAVSFGFSPLAVYQIENHQPASHLNPYHRFSLRHGRRSHDDFEISIHGRDNVSNAAAVVVMLLELGYAVGDIRYAIRDFRGVDRRQQVLFQDTDHTVIDDYGHHPTEIASTLSSLRSRAEGRLLVAFEPHRYSRTASLMDEFGKCFKQADRLWLLDIYAAHENPLPGVSSESLAHQLAKQGVPVVHHSDASTLPAAIRSELNPGDWVVFLGAGTITRSAQAFADILKGEHHMDLNNLSQSLSRCLSQVSTIKTNELLGPKTTLKVGGPADMFVVPGHCDDLAATLKWAKAHHVPLTLLGRGSNLLIKDKGIRGLVVSLSHETFSEISLEGDRLVCGAGTRLKQLTEVARKNGLAGLEFLEGIPGCVGGALRMNAGAMSRETFGVVEQMTTMDRDGNLHVWKASEVATHYRRCPLLTKHIALSAVFKGTPSEPETVKRTMDDYCQRRKGSQPIASSAGCMFKNPENIPAGKLIDELGLKGTRIGDAMISEVHGNFIVNLGDARSSDVITLIELVKDRAKSNRGIDLEVEVQVVGE
jgi:UDP-N-acetylmuramate--L-alanine ligase/UDP-N-acetylenolpyruvoylglucosamine reductase